MKKPTTKKAAAATKGASELKTKKKAPKKVAVAKVAKEEKVAVKAPRAAKPAAKPVAQPKKVHEVKHEVKTVAPAPVPAPIVAEPKPAPRPVVQHAPKPRAPMVRSIHGVGRRKAAVARVWLKRGRGMLVINERPYEQYFDTEKSRLSVTAPLRAVKDASLFDAYVNVVGGGLPAQADAVALAVARALLTVNADLRPALRHAGLLTVDSRVKERKKYGRRAARRRFQFVKR